MAKLVWGGGECENFKYVNIGEKSMENSEKYWLVGKVLRNEETEF